MSSLKVHFLLSGPKIKAAAPNPVRSSFSWGNRWLSLTSLLSWSCFAFHQALHKCPCIFHSLFRFIHLRTAAFPVKPAAIIKAPLIFSLIMFDCTNNPLNLNGMRHSKHVFSGKVLIRCIIKTLPRNTFIVSHSTSSSAVLPRAAERVRSIHGSDQSLQPYSQNTTQLFGC